MSSQQSNLSNPHYSYDMVVATTQASVNSTMMEWLDKQTTETFTQAYVYNPKHAPANNGVIPTDFAALKSAVGFDPFTIPDGTDTTDPRIVKLMRQKFMFAFQIEIGLPDFPLNLIPPVVEFNKEGSYVTYNMVCKTFKVIVLQPGLYGSTTWINISQENSPKPWVIKYTVDLDLRTDSLTNHFHNLPVKTQQEIKNLGEEMFSIQQLFLDLNTAGLTDTSAIVGLDPTSTAYTQLTSVFLNTYMHELSKNGGVALGISAVSKHPFPSNVSIVPTNLNFEISSYKGADGKATADFDDYTLNYLIMSEGRTLPAPVQFTWNWVDKINTQKYAGVMAINKNIFATYLNSLIAPSLKDICKIPTAHFHCNLISAAFKWGYTTDPASHSYSAVKNGGSHVLTFKYKKSASDSDTFVPNWGNFGVDYTVNSDIYIEGTAIKVVTTLLMHCHVNVDGGVTDGNWAKYESTTLYTLGVDAHGTISVSKSGPTVKNLSEKPDVGIWSKIVTAGTIDGCVDKIKSSLSTWIKGFLGAEASHIANMLNGSGTWVFPGGKTFTFTDIAFSDNQDLVSHILYVKPKAGK
jgi:hypothetical protein